MAVELCAGALEDSFPAAAVLGIPSPPASAPDLTDRSSRAFFAGGFGFFDSREPALRRRFVPDPILA